MSKNTIEFDTDFDFGFEFGDDLSETVEQKEAEAQKAQSKADAMYSAIMPLLNNLKKNPDKPTINWPNRDKKIDEFIKKLDNILKA